jgi:hypothetical protein
MALSVTDLSIIFSSAPSSATCNVTGSITVSRLADAAIVSSSQVGCAILDVNQTIRDLLFPELMVFNRRKPEETQQGPAPTQKSLNRPILSLATKKKSTPLGLTPLQAL